MANFMGPMAPPQAAPPQPQKLDIRTSPGQRQQFKDFMRQRTAMMPMTSAPVAPPPMMPMMPQMPPQMPLRMEMGGDVDIFESQNYHDGGVVSSLDRLQDLATMGSAFSEQLQSTVMGEGADRMRLTGGIGGSLSLSGPGSPRPPISISPPPGADVSAFFDNLRERLSNQDLKIADKSGTGINNPDPAPTLNSSKPDNTRLLGSGDNIDQGFLNSPEFKALDFTGPATMDMYTSPYFGQIGSGSQGKAQDAAYEAYLERTGGGNKAPSGTPTAPMQPARNLFSGTVEPKSYGLAGMGTTFSFEDGGAVPPRNVEIKGQPHMLSYITPDEADILEALGGSGEPGPMGIPSYPGGYGGEGMGGFGEGPDGRGGGGGADDRDGPDFGMSPGQSQAQFGTPEFAGMTSDEAKDTLAGGGGSEQAQAVQDALAAQAAAEAARAEAERARKAREVQAQIQRAIKANEQARKQRADAITSQVQQAVQASAKKTAQQGSPQDLLSAFSADVQTPALTDEQLGISPVDTTQPDDLVESNQSLLGDDVLMDDLLDIQPTTAAEQAQAAADATVAGIGMDDEYDDVVGTPDYDDPNREGYEDGLPTGLEFADTKRGRFTTNLAGLTAKQRAALPGYMNPSENTGIVAGVLNALDIDPTRDVYGYEFDDTGRVTGMVGPGLGIPGPISAGLSLFSDIFGTPPETTEDLLNQGVYTGFGEGSRIGGPDAGGRDTPIIKLPDDPCPEGFVMKDGACTPIASTGDGGSGSLGNITPGPKGPISPVIVPSTRQPIPNTLQGPVGYGMPTAGQINPFAVSSAAQYQQMLNQQAMNPPQFAPIRFQDGGPVSPDLDRAADNFLQSLMPAA